MEISPMNRTQNHTDVVWQLGHAIQHRDAMSGIHRNTPTQATQQWRDEANEQVRRLQRQEKRLAQSLT
jgi:hypothetical protein